MQFAIDYYGIDNVMYGSDYPCWEPAEALKLLAELQFPEADKEKLFVTNARRILNLRDPTEARTQPAAHAPELV
jgi:aminocarboxymuconate-semialdehyde decarboxylase